MKIALSFQACHRRGGIERCLLEAANFLATRDHEPHLYALEWDEAALHKSVVRHRVAKPVRARLIRLARFVLACRRAMVLNSVHHDVHGAFGVTSPRGGVLWVPSVHAAWVEISRSRRTVAGQLKQLANPYHPLILALERKYMAQGGHRRLIAFTPEVRDDLGRHYGVPAQDVDILPNGFAPMEFNVAGRQNHRNKMRRQLGYTAEDKVVIFVANEFERKGFLPLLEGLAAQKDRRVHLLAVGRLNPQAHKAYISELGMAERVTFTGPTAEVMQYYAAADIFALPTYYEAWGLVIVEALACGLPVLTSRLAGAAMTVQEGRTGELLDNPRDATEIANKLGALLAHEAPSAPDISATVQDYAWPQILAKYEVLLERYAGASSSG